MFSKKKIKGEDGTAVILAIGICALMLALVLNFASNTILSEKIAYNSNSRVKADFLLKTGIERVLTLIKYCESSNMILDELYSFSPDSDLDSPFNQNMMTINGIDYFIDKEAKWQYIKVNGELIGRVAYSSISTSRHNKSGIGKLPVSYCVDTGLNAFANYTESVSEDTFYCTGTDQNGNQTLGRPGRSLNELYLFALDESLQSDTVLQNLSAVNAANIYPGAINTRFVQGKLQIGSQWIDIPYFLDSSGVTNQNKQSLTQKTTTGTYEEPEAFWLDIQTDSSLFGFGVRERNELFHRFNIARSDWPMPENSFKWLEENITGSEKNYYPLKDKSFCYDGQSIPWIKNWQLSYDDGPDTAWKYQIAANLIDYCDSDLISTTDNEDSPSFTGNEKVPYINEVIFTFDSSVKRAFGHSYYVFRMKEVNVELVDMYNIDSGDFAVHVSGELECFLGDYKLKMPISSEIKVSLDQKNIYSVGSDLNFGLSGFKRSIVAEAGSNGIGGLRLNNLKAKLTDVSGKEFYDYSNLVNKTDYVELIPKHVNNATKSVKISFEVDDPRQNLRSDDWVMVKGKGTLGKINKICKPTMGNDNEFDDALNKISTSFVRNAPMITPWEVGFIHRGAKWETLNLKKYNNFEKPFGGIAYSAGGSFYKDGDANILDQVKVGSSVLSPAKLNLNNPVNPFNYNDPESDEPAYNPLVSLFTYLNIGVEDYNNPGFSIQSNSIDIYQANKLASLIQGEILSEVESESSQFSSFYNGRSYIEKLVDGRIDVRKMLQTRAQLAREEIYYLGKDQKVDSEPSNFSVFFDGSIIEQLNDASQEEIIGKVINLTKAEQNLFDTGTAGINFIVTAESIRHGEITGIRSAFINIKKSPTTNKWDIYEFKYLQ